MPLPTSNGSKSEPEAIVLTTPYAMAHSAVHRLTVRRTHKFMSHLISRSPTLASAPTVASNPPRMILERLHARVAQTYRPDFDAYIDQSAIVAISSSNGIAPGVSLSMAQQILQCYASSDADITGLRVSRVYSFTDNNRFWAVLEWRIGIDTDVLAIFQIDNTDDSDSASNWLMHHGQGRNIKGTFDRRWVSTSVSWSVTSFGYLKSLFGAARHILGILELPARDSLTQYDPQSCSEEAYCHPYTLLIAKND
jgi:hypothetical protein